MISLCDEYQRDVLYVVRRCTRAHHKVRQQEHHRQSLDIGPCHLVTKKSIKAQSVLP